MPPHHPAGAGTPGAAGGGRSPESGGSRIGVSGLHQPSPHPAPPMLLLTLLAEGEPLEKSLGNVQPQIKDLMVLRLTQLPGRSTSQRRPWPPSPTRTHRTPFSNLNSQPMSTCQKSITRERRPNKPAGGNVLEEKTSGRRKLRKPEWSMSLDTIGRS